MDRKLEQALESERKKQQEEIAAKEREARQAEAITVASEALTGAMAQVLKGDQGEQGPKGDDGQDGKDGRDGKDGLDGKDGKDGRDGIDGQDGKDGLDGKDGRDGKDGKQGPAGAQGPRGIDGEKGDPPRHQIQNGKVRFEQSSGNWGNWISLQNVTIKNGGGGGGAQVVNTENVVYSQGVDHLYSLQEAINHIWSAGGSGRDEDFAITENGDGTINLTGGDAVLRSTEDPDGELKAYTVPGVNNLLLTDNATNYILVDYNNGDPMITASANLNDVVNVITKTTIYAINRLGNELNIVDTRAFNVDFMRKNAIKDYKVNGFEHAGGAFVSDLGNRNVAVTASEFYLLNQGIQSAALDTSTTGVFEYVYQDGLGGYTRVASQTQIDNLNYDDGSGTLAAVGTNKYFCHYVYLVLNDPSHYKVVYGRELHNHLGAAQAEQVPSTLPSDLDSLSTAVFIGKIIVLQGVDAFEDIQSPFTQVLTSSTATNHNNLAGLQGGAVGDYQHLTTAEVTLVNGAIQSTEKGAANGVATLGAGGKIPSAQLPSSVMEYLGNWDASTNTPTLIDGTGDNGDVYRVNVSGTQDLGSGSQTFAVGDWVIYNGTIWERSDNADAVSSVNGQVGTVVLDADDIDDSTTTHKFATQVQLDDITSNTTHRTSDGSDHTFINQSVTTSASPTFAGVTSTAATTTTVSTTATSNVGAAAKFVRKTSGDMVDNFGVQVLFGIEDATSGLQTIGKIVANRDGGDSEGTLTFRAGTNGGEAFMAMDASQNKVVISKNTNINNQLTVTGNVGIGTSSPTRAKLVVNGSVSYNNGSYGYLASSGSTGTSSGVVSTSIYASHRIISSEFNAISDLRVKDNFHPVKDALSIVDKLNVSYYNKHTKEGMRYGEIGLLAQELKEIFPLAVKTGPGDVMDENGEWIEVDDFHTVNYDMLAALSLKAAQELNQKIDALNISTTDHPYHSSIEGSRADNIYSGIAKLKQGKAVINLDQHSNMTEGTFEALNKNIRTFTTNEQTWDMVRSKVEGNQLIIECQDPEATIEVSWLVIGERQDEQIKEAPWVDDEGNNVIEQLKA